MVLAGEVDPGDRVTVDAREGGVEIEVESAEGVDAEETPAEEPASRALLDENPDPARKSRPPIKRIPAHGAANPKGVG